MVIRTRLISFRQATEILQAETGAVRCLVVVERSLPAVYVTQVGYREPYEHQLLRVDEEGRAFDLAVGGIEGLVQTGHLRIERDALDSFITHETLSGMNAGKVSVCPATKTEPAKPDMELTHQLGRIGQAEANTGAGNSDFEGWKRKAQSLAKEIIERDREKDLFPSQELVADEVAKMLRQSGVFGTGGKPLAGAYIKRHALKGISSEQGRLLSTAFRKGK